VDLERDLARLRRERNLYRKLLELSGETEFESFLEEALALVVDLTDARNGYLELHDRNEAPGEPGWFIAHGFRSDEIDNIRSRVSKGIIAQAIATGQTIDTPSALLDPRFADRESVQGMRIDAVLCIPIGSDPPLGVLYLQGRKETGPFTDSDRERAETFAHHLARLADHQLLRLQVARAADPTQPYRASLRADDLIGRSPAIADLLRDVSMVRGLDVSVLLTGESGTGKSQIARLIHDSGPRAGRPFVEVNCAALPEGLVESELFGALAGAHSTATRRMTGKVEAAEGGTLFLDEVGEISEPNQVKLLQLLQSRSYYPLGSPTAVNADVRVIAATNRDLEAAVADGGFRADLYYRLHVLELRVPSLAERRSDIPDLARHFCERAVAQHRLGRLELSSGVLHALEAAEWPGQVRQLQHAVEAAAIRAAGAGAARIERAHVFPETAASVGEPEEDLTFQEATRRFQARLLAETLEATGWNVSETARRLDLARSHVYTLIRAFGLERD
jgi:transcriptional regulator with GAF, ATPase, and Fis domain